MPFLELVCIVQKRNSLLEEIIHIVGYAQEAMKN